MSADKPTVAFRIPREPLALRGELRELLGTDPDTAAVQISRRVSSQLWRAWRDELQTRKVTPAELRSVFVGYEREAWLWVLGNRPWTQMVGGLAGRVDRRFPGQ